MFAGMWLAAWADGFEFVSGWTIVLLGVLTVLSVVIDVAATAMGAKRVGAGKLAMLGAALGTVFGGLFFGWITSVAMRVTERDRRAVMIEGGMQNSGLALGIIAVQFNSDLGMVIIASLWGMWHIVSGLSLAFFWRRKDARSAH